MPKFFFKLANFWYIGVILGGSSIVRAFLNPENATLIQDTNGFIDNFWRIFRYLTNFSICIEFFNLANLSIFIEFSAGDKDGHFLKLGCASL